MLNGLTNIGYSLLYDYTKNRWMINECKSRIHGLALVLHHVTDEFVAINDSCKCTIAEFKELVSLLTFKGYKFVSITEALKIISNKNPEKFVIMTFDDIPKSVFFNAYPYLQSLGLPFAVFITINYLDTEGYITTNQLLEMSVSPLCTIGAHTLSHPYLREVENYREELVLSKIALERILNKKVNYMAYPYGQFSTVSRQVRIAARDAGYLCAFSTIGASLNDNSTKDLFFLPRVAPYPSYDNYRTISFTAVHAMLSFLSWPIRVLFKKIKK